MDSTGVRTVQAGVNAVMCPCGTTAWIIITLRLLAKLQTTRAPYRILGTCDHGHTIAYMVRA